MDDGPSTSSNALIPSISIDALLRRRDAMAERIREAHRLIREVHDLAEAVVGADASEHVGWRISLTFTSSSRHHFECDDGASLMLKEIDARAWGYLLKESGLQSFLDAEAREKWRKAVETNDVPELTRANIEATFAMLFETRGEMFERGVLEIFRQLSWDYKTNLPVRFGKRIILTHVIDTLAGKWEWASPSFSGTNKLDDLVRVMSILDGKPEPDHRQGTFHRLNAMKWPTANALAELEYFSLRGFKNSNCHLTFTRGDLVDKLNVILAKHHPNALPPARGDS